MTYPYSFITENELKSHEKLCKNKDFCGIILSSEKSNVLEFNQYINSDKLSYIIYADTELWIKRVYGCANNLEKSSISIGEWIPFVHLMSTIWAFDHIERKHTLYHGKGCMENFCSSLRELATNIFKFEKKKMLPFTKEELNLYQD